MNKAAGRNVGVCPPWQVLGYSDDAPDKRGKTFGRYVVHGTLKETAGKFAGQNISFLVAIGHNATREKLARLAEDVGWRRANLWGGDGQNASLVQGWSGSLRNSYKLVAVSKLDLILNRRFDGLSLLIKMDVEGFEMEVLKGAEQTLGMSPRPTWMVEICLTEGFPGGRNDTFCETFETFLRRGYKARIADGEQRVVEQADVLRWARQGHVDFGSHNYLFC
jgi:hypothetical protein